MKFGHFSSPCVAAVAGTFNKIIAMYPNHSFIKTGVEIIIKITVVDSIMGSGKTTAMLEKVNADLEGSYIYVTPYLSEIDRVIEQTQYRFKQPYNTGRGKLDALHKLLATGESVVTTHALFLMATAETVQLIHEGDYTLILDEAMDIFKEYNEVVKSLDNKTITKGDVRWLKQEGYILVSDDYCVEWSGAAADDFHYSEVERLAKSGCLRCIDDTLYWEYPVEVFTAFKRTYILTYLFEGSMLAAYMRIYGLPYTKCSAERTESGGFRLCLYDDGKDRKSALFPLVNIYAGELNRIGSKTNAFSVNWLKGRSSEEIRVIQNAMRNYKGKMNAPTDSVMWTTTKQHDIYKKLEKIRGFKYIRRLTADEHRLPDEEKRKLQCFVSCTARATNDYAERTTLLYLLNRYLPPEIEKYFSRRGSPIDEDCFATGELLQWIWRSAIRNDHSINLYIPSSRMRNLLFRWFGVYEAVYQPRTKRVLEKALL